MVETLTITASQDLQDLANALYRVGNFLGMGYGLAYYGPAQKYNENDEPMFDEEGKPIEDDTRLEIVMQWAGARELGLLADNEDRPSTPTVEPLPIGQQVVQAEPAVGTEGEVIPDDADDADEEDRVRFTIKARKGGKGYAKTKRRIGFSV